MRRPGHDRPSTRASDTPQNGTPIQAYVWPCLAPPVNTMDSACNNFCAPEGPSGGGGFGNQTSRSPDAGGWRGVRLFRKKHAGVPALQCLGATDGAQKWTECMGQALFRPRGLHAPLDHYHCITHRLLAKLQPSFSFPTHDLVFDLALRIVKQRLGRRKLSPRRFVAAMIVPWRFLGVTLNLVQRPRPHTTLWP